MKESVEVAKSVTYSGATNVTALCVWITQKVAMNMTWFENVWNVRRTCVEFAMVGLRTVIVVEHDACGVV